MSPKVSDRKINSTIVKLSLAFGFVIVIASPGLSQDSGETDRPSQQRQRSTDNADYDNQPYYVDGILYRPYQPEAKKPPIATPATSVAPVIVPQRSQNIPDTVVSPEPEPRSVNQESAPESISRSDDKNRSQTQSSSENLALSRPSSTKTPAPLKKRTRYKTAIIQSLDKITAETVRFEVPIGKSIHYKGLIYSIKACEVTADEEVVQDVMVYMQIRTKPVVTNNLKDPPKSKEIFSVWSFGRAPGLNPVQHPIYDAWVIGCRKPQA
jgi:hypothetical protein